MQKKKVNLSPEAAKILERYRSASTARPPADGNAPPGSENPAAPPKPSSPPPPSAMRRSGTRGK
jgi:hypothetical protein